MTGHAPLVACTRASAHASRSASVGARRYHVRRSSSLRTGCTVKPQCASSRSTTTWQARGARGQSHRQRSIRSGHLRGLFHSSKLKRVCSRARWESLAWSPSAEAIARAGAARKALRGRHCIEATLEGSQRGGKPQRTALILRDANSQRKVATLRGGNPQWLQPARRRSSAHLHAR